MFFKRYPESIEKSRYILNGNKTLIYTKGINDKLYNIELKKFLARHKNKYRSIRRNEKDIDLLEKLKLSYIFFDEIFFEKYLNTICIKLVSRLEEMSKCFLKKDIKRFIWIARLLNYTMLIFRRASSKFMIDKMCYIELYNDADKVLDVFFEVFRKNFNQFSEAHINNIQINIAYAISHFAATKAVYAGFKKVDSFVGKYIDLIKGNCDALVIVLLISSTQVYFSRTSNYYMLLNELYENLLEEVVYSEDYSKLLALLKVSKFLGKDNDFLYQVYLNKKNLLSTSERIDMFEYLMESKHNYKEVLKEFVQLYSEGVIDQNEERNLGFSIVKIYANLGNISEARKIFFEIYNKLGCSDSKDATKYIYLMNILGILKSHRSIYEELYINHIFKQFLKNSKSDVTAVIFFIEQQTNISNINKLENMEFIYRKFFKERINNLIENKSYEKIVYISPFNEFNDYIFPIHFYNKLIDEKVLIVNLEEERLEFFNNYRVDGLGFNKFSLLNFSNAVFNVNKHWKDFYCSWQIDFENRKCLCNGINIYQGVYEQLSRVQKKFELDFSSFLTRRSFDFFKIRIDRCMYVGMQNIYQNINVLPQYFVATTAHYPIWSIFRDLSYHINNYRKISFLHVSPIYENYLKKMKNNFLENMTVCNLTKDRNSRVAGLGGSSRFLKYFEEKKYKYKLRDLQVSKQSEMNISGELFERIKQAKADNKTIICLLGKIVYDLAVPEMSGTFKDMKEWAAESTKFVSERDDIFAIIKPHPHEINYSISQYPNEYFADFVQVKSSNIYVMDHKEASIGDLEQYVDIFILWNGTSVVDLAKNKKNIIVCDDWANKDYGLGLFQPKTKKEYFDSIIGGKSKFTEASLCEIQKRAYLYEEYLKYGNYYIKNKGVIMSNTNVDRQNTYLEFKRFTKNLKKTSKEFDLIYDDLF